MIKKARNLGCIDFYHLISGCDVPLLNSTLFDKVVNSGQKGFMGLVNLDLSTREEISRRYRIFHFNDLVDRQSHGIKNFVCRGFVKMEMLLANHHFYFRNELLMPVYKGSQWWSLSNEVIEYITNYLLENPQYMKRFRWTSCIDEVFFHTIVLNSPYAERVETQSHRYVDWIAKNKKGKSPKILDAGDISLVEHSGCWFARKTDPVKSKDFIEYFENKAKCVSNVEN